MAWEAKRKDFPPAFQWGVATSAYQIEGAATLDGRGPSIWDEFSHTPSLVLGGDTGDVACDHYHRYREDIAIMAEMGVTHYRFSISWPRVLPTGARSAMNAKGLGFYDRLVDALVEHGITPTVTLYHWDLPAALQSAGGWLNAVTTDRFAEYAELMVAVLGDRVKQWITHNEPWCTAFLGHVTGEHAPGIRDQAAGAQAAHHLLVSHGKAVTAMRAARGDVQVGITLNLHSVYPESDHPDSLRAAAWLDAFTNRWFLDPLLRGRYPEPLDGWLGAVSEVNPRDFDLIAVPIDFLGVNYYTAQVVAPATDAAASWPVQVVTATDRVTAIGWPVMPQGLTDLLLRIHRDYGPLPTIVTENGAAYADQLVDGMVQDPERIQFLAEHIEAVRQALALGADVRGYYVWSLLDNFEWAYGYLQRFGLVYVDFATQTRIPKASARWYQRFLASTK